MWSSKSDKIKVIDGLKRGCYQGVRISSVRTKNVFFY